MSNDREYFINVGVNSKERFDVSKFLEYTDNFDPLTTNFFRTIKKLPERQKYFVQSEEGRPDLISYKIYKSTQYWWVILLYNDITNSDDVSIGLILSIPNIDDLEDKFFSLRKQEVANNS